MSSNLSAGKKADSVVKIQIQAGKANPAPPVGTALGPKGINIMQFCKEFNEKTASMSGMVIPAVISIYKDRSFTFILKKPPVPSLIKKAISLAAGSKEPGRSVAGSISMAQISEISELKMPDLNCYDISAAIRMVSGTATSMGVDIVE